MSEQYPNDSEELITKILEACKGVLPEEDLADIETMESEEALTYLQSYLPEFGIDPEEFLLKAGLIENIETLSEEELSWHQGKYRADDIKYDS